MPQTEPVKQTQPEFRQFLNDIAPFFYKQAIVYVDAGAFTGEVYGALLDSPLGVREAYLVEPNKASFGVLEQKCAQMGGAGKVFRLYNLALSEEPGELTLHNLHSMSRVESASAGGQTDNENIYSVRATTLDALSEEFASRHVNLLKIDTEGAEIGIIRGARKMLEAQNVDVIYIEAGMNRSNTGLSYYQDIDNLLREYGYRIFKIYEQQYEWQENSPFLRRVNIAFMSERLAQRTPYRLLKDHYDLQGKLKEIQKQYDALTKEVAAKNADMDALRIQLSENDAGRQQAADALAAAQENITSLRAMLAEREAALTQAYKDIEKKESLIESLVRQHREERENGTALLTSLGRQIEDKQQQIAAMEQAIMTLEAKREKAPEPPLAPADLREEAEKAHEGRREALKRYDQLAAEFTQYRTRTNDLQQTLMKERQAAADTNHRLAYSTRQIETYKDLVRSNYQLYVDAWDKQKIEAARKQAALDKIARMENYLSYRIGTAFVGTIEAHPITGWFRLPFALWRAHRAYKSDQRRAAAAPLAPALKAAPVFAQGALSDHIPVKAQTQTYRIAAAFEGHHRVLLRATAICSNLDADIDIVFETEDRDGTIISKTLTLSHDHPVVLIEGVMLPDDRLFTIRKIRGVPSLIKLDIAIDNNGATGDAAQTITGKRQTSLFSALALRHRAAANVLYEAQKMISAGSHEHALEYVREEACEVVRPALGLLEANRLIGQDAQWLSRVNDYLKEYAGTPLRLRDGGGSLFSRLDAEQGKAVALGPVVSVIMPAHNAEKTLMTAAQSILNQSWRPLELIIIDDASSDGTARVMHELARMDKRVRTIFNTRNVGPYASKNMALDMATGTYITGHDADDWAHPQRIESHVQAQIQTDGRIKASLTYMLRIRENGYFSHISKVSLFSPDGMMRQASISCLFERDFLTKHLGYWDSVRFAADSEMIARAETILGESGFGRFPQIGMLCLDTDNSLTNSDIHGICKTAGMSPVRRAYKEHFQQWHGRCAQTGTYYMPFPHKARPFDAPNEMRVNTADILFNLTRAGDAAQRDFMHTGGDAAARTHA